METEEAGKNQGQRCSNLIEGNHYGVGVVRTQAGYTQSGRGWWCQAGDLVFKSTFTVIHGSMGVGS